MAQLQVAGFEFFNDFDSANLAKVELVAHNESVVAPANNSGKAVVPEVPDVEFNVWSKPDCCGTEFENTNRTWFYFGVKAPSAGLNVRINVVDINKQAKMFSQGMAPVYRIVPGKLNWERIRDRPSYMMENDIFTLTFKFKTADPLCITYLAFTYPFSYTDLQSYLGTIDSKMSAQAIPQSKDDIYYVRELLCHSLENRNVELLTISSYHNMSSERETRLKSLFPNEDVPRPFRFIGKKIIFVSARVHPGETPSSFVFNGLLNLLLNREDPIAVILRKHYVFKLIPFLNPDGVARGHYRTDTRGVNLNRMYLKPLISLHPSVFAARSLIRYYHYGFEKEDNDCESINLSDGSKSSSNENNSISQGSDNKLSSKVSHMTLEEAENNKNLATKSWCSKCNQYCRNCGNLIEENLENGDNFHHGDSNYRQSGLFLYIDMHGHASKKGIFMYGNHFQDVEENVDCMLLPKLMSLNSHHFHFTSCNFTERNMYLKDKRDGMSREGSGRVAVLKLTGLTQSYTLECNYNTGRLVNPLPPTIKENNKQPHTLNAPPKYSPHIFEEVGKALGASILDLTGQNPYTRLTNSEFHSLNGLREWLKLYCCNELGETQQTPARVKLRHSASLRSQGKPIRTTTKARLTSSKAVSKKMATKITRTTSIPIDRKENLGYHIAEPFNPQPSTSSTNFIRNRASLPSNKSMAVRSRFKKEIATRKSQTNLDKPKQFPNSNKGNSNKAPAAAKLKQESQPKLKATKEKVQVKESFNESEDGDSDRIKLHEICFIKDTEGGKKVIAKYKNFAEDSRVCEDNLVVAWDANSANPQVFSHKTSFLSKNFSEPGSSKQSNGGIRIHNFAKNSNFVKNKRSKRTLRRLTGTADSCGKIDKLKKRKKLQSKLS